MSTNRARASRRKGRRAGAAAEIPAAPAIRHPSRVALISFLILFLELALIRFIPSEIKAISYFTNLLLFSAFFGLGLGCILWKREV
jgi:hypothetical protein